MVSLVDPGRATIRPSMCKTPLQRKYMGQTRFNAVFLKHNVAKAPPVRARLAGTGGLPFLRPPTDNLGRLNYDYILSLDNASGSCFPKTGSARRCSQIGLLGPSRLAPTQPVPRACQTTSGDNTSVLWGV